MTILNPKRWSYAMGASLLATIAALPVARAELVYENDSAAIEDRDDTRNALGASQKMQVTLQAPAAVTAAADPAPAAQAAPASQAPQAEVQTYSKSELMRRERQREELKNEDILQERLEELRLRDERRRVEAVLAAEGKATAPAEGTAAPAAAVMKEEIVVAPVTESGGSPAPASATLAPLGTASSSSASLSTELSASESTKISVAPRVGMSNMIGQGGFFDVRPRFSTGISAQMSASENFSLEVGYTYNEYGVAMNSSNPWAIMMQQQNMMYGGRFETVAMKQNVIDMGLKVHFLGTESKIRPFVGAGGAYSKSFINFDSRILSQMTQYGALSPDYEVNAFHGYLSTGLDVKVAKNITVGTEFKYYAVLSARESMPFNNYYGAMYYGGQMPGSYYGVAPGMGGDTAVAGGSLARSSFYSILGNVTFTF